MLGDVIGMQRQPCDDVLGEDIPGGFGVRSLDLDLHVKTAWPQDSRIDHVLAVGRADHDYVLYALDAVDLAEQLGHDRVLDVAGHTGAAGAEDRVHLVEEHDDRHPLAGLLPGPLEDQPDVPLGLAHVLVQQFRALDVQEEALAFLGRLARRRVNDALAGQLGASPGYLLGQGVGDRLGDQRLAAAGRPVQQDALRRPELVLLEQVGVQVGQLDGVPDLLDLRSEPANLLVGDIRHFLQDQLFDLGLGNPLVYVPGSRLQQQRVPGSALSAEQRLGRPDYPLLVRVRDHQRAIAAVKQFLEHDDLAHGLISERDDDILCLVQHQFLTWPQLGELDAGAARYAHLPAASEHISRLVVVGLQEDAES